MLLDKTIGLDAMLVKKVDVLRRSAEKKLFRKLRVEDYKTKAFV